MPRPSSKRKNGATSTGKAVRDVPWAEPAGADTPAAQSVQTNGWRNRITRYGEEAPDQLLAHDKNWRIHPKNQQDALNGVLKEVGWVQNVIVSERSGKCLDGHLRIQMAISEGQPTVPITYVDLSPEEEAIILATIDPLSALAVMDDKLLAELLKDVKVSDDGLQELLNDLSLQCGIDTGMGGLTDPDAVPDVPETPVTVLGDLWVLGRHRLLCGDSTSVDAVERLMGGTLGNMAFCDPPYGYEYESNHHKGGNPFGALQNDDKLLDFIPVLNLYLAPDSAVYVCASHQTVHLWRPLIEASFTYKNLIVWKKNNWSMGDLTGAYAGQHELIFFAHKGLVKLRGDRHRDVWEFDREPPKDHPTQKPVDLVSFAIENTSDQGGTVLDLFGGSGSTLIACEKTARNARLMEIDPKYCDVIVKRWEQFSGQQATLDGDGRTFAEIKAERFLVKLGAQDQIAEEAFT